MLTFSLGFSATSLGDSRRLSRTQSYTSEGRCYRRRTTFHRRLLGPNQTKHTDEAVHLLIRSSRQYFSIEPVQRVAANATRVA